MPKKQKPVAVRLEPAIARQLRDCSKATGISQRRLVNSALERSLPRMMLAVSRLTTTDSQ